MRLHSGSAAGLWIAVGASFAVYLIPLVGPHASWLVGETLYAGFTRHAGGRSGGWVATEFAVALSAQLLVAAVIAWSLRGSRARLALPVLIAPAVFAAIEYLFMAAIPAHFLIEPETMPQVAGLEERCVIHDAGLIQMRMPAARTGRLPEVWWAQRSTGRYVLVHPAECRAVDVALPEPTLQPGGRVDFMLAPTFATADGATIFDRTETASGRRSWWALHAGSTHLEPLPLPGDPEGTPVLSDDSTAVAWLDRVAVPEPPLPYRLHVRSLRPPAAERVIDLSGLGPATYVIAEFDDGADEAWLWRDNRLIAIDASGLVVRRLPPAESIRPQVQTFVRSGDGVLQWDAYRDNDAYWLAWQTPNGSGRTRVPLGRSITSAALDPSGRFVAVSTTTTVSVGQVRDAVYLLGTRDGAEVFRRYLPTYTRSTVAFFDGGLFAYSDLSGTHVLELP